MTRLVLKDKVCLVTGANAGIGKYTCLGLARAGAEVVMAARDSSQVEKAKEEIIERTGNVKIHSMIADLSSMEEVSGLAREFVFRFKRLDVLVNNAGIFLSKFKPTVDGFETQWAVNYLAPYILTRRLLDLMVNSGPSRIINVSSNAHFKGTINFKDLQGKAGYNGLKAYSQSKLGNVLFTKSLALRLQQTKVSANALHPGVVRTGIGNRNNPSWMSWLWILGKPFMMSVEKGAVTSLYLATSPEVEGISGSYFVRSKPISSSRESRDPEVARRLWQVTEQMTEKYLG